MTGGATTHADVVVIGSGFGGLGAAIELCGMGRSVLVLEAMNYPGGCGSTHQRKGVWFESGATLVTGVEPGQLFHRWLQSAGITLEGRRLSPVMTQVINGQSIALMDSRDAWVKALQEAGVDGGRVRSFLSHQERIASPLWHLFDAPEDLPPLSVAALGRHVRRSPALLPLLPWVGRPLSALLRHHGLDKGVFRRLIDGLCQITVQCGAEEAETSFALGALESFFRGTTHLDGGVGALAEALVRVIEARGGQMRYAHRATGIRRDGPGWLVQTNRGTFRAKTVVANALPGDVAGMLAAPPPRLGRLDASVATGWGAAMLYRQLDDSVPPAAFHRQLLGSSPTDGHSVFVSGSAAHEERGARTLVVSSHVRLPIDAEGVQRVHGQMRRTIQTMAPDLDAATLEEWTASPRTFARFTRRSSGHVGGVPRAAGLGAYLGLWPRPLANGLWMVGDSVLFGQSLLAAAVGGHRVAAAIGA